MIRESEYPDDFWGNIFLCDQSRSTRDEKCAYEIRDEKSLILFLDACERPSTESSLFDPACELMLAHRHEWDLSTSKKCESKNKREKQ